MYFICREDTQTYITLHREDEENFYSVINSDVFKTPNKFRLIKDKDEIKKILEERYSSRNRTSEYTAGLPSATLISSALFPYNLDSRTAHNSIPLLKWNNDISAEDLQAQKIKNKISTDSGSYVHKILELSLKDRNTRDFDKSRNIDKYIELANNDKEIIDMIDNFADRKQYFVNMAKSTLKDFFKEQIPVIDPVFNELFVVNKGLQGAIDLVNYKNGKLYISDFKTSKKSCSKVQIPSKGYLRQLYIYSRMMLKLGYITQKEYDNLNFCIYFFNWNSGNSAVYEYTKQEVDSSKAYCEFILNWYFKMKDMDIDVSEVI